MQLALRHIQDFPALSALEENALLFDWDARDIVCMLYGFFDESGEHGPDGKLVQLTLGGFIARWPQVESLIREWRAALDEVCWSEFHMREFASDEYNFDRWRPRRKAELERFVSILCEHVSHFCAFSYKVADKEKAFADTYETALSRIVLNARKVIDQQGDRVRLVFAKTPEISGEMIGRYLGPLNWEEAFVESYEVARASGSPPLQAAEIVARGFAREVRDGLVTHSFGRVKASAKTFDSWVHR